MAASSGAPDDKLRADLASLRIDRDLAALKRLPRRRRRWWLWALGLVALAAAATIFLRPPPLVSVAPATVTQAGQAGPEAVLSGSGYIVTGERYISIGVRVPGRIERYFVEEGQTVEKGAPLVQLDDRDYRAAVARADAGLGVAQANLALAEADLKRIRTLQSQGVASRQELDVQENRVNVARATIDQLQAELAKAKVDLDYTTLRAPSSGVILAKSKEVGEIAVPGGFAGSGDLIRLANLSDMRAQVDVNEADLNRVHLGQPAFVTPDAYPDSRYDAKVVKLYPQVDRQKGTLRVEVQLQTPDEKLLPDMSARVTFLSEPSDEERDAAVVTIPSTALQRDANGNSFVWAVSGGKVRRQRVETAGSTGDRVRVASGLQGGETLVVGDDELSEGQRVRVE